MKLKKIITFNLLKGQPSHEKYSNIDKEHCSNSFS